MATAEPLAASLSKTAREFESMLNSSKCRPLDQFLEAPKLGASIPLMAELFKKAGVESRAELESAVKAQFRVAEVKSALSWFWVTVIASSLNSIIITKVRDSWEELLDVEANWDAFLATVAILTKNHHRDKQSPSLWCPSTLTFWFISHSCPGWLGGGGRPLQGRSCSSSIASSWGKYQCPSFLVVHILNGHETSHLSPSCIWMGRRPTKTDVYCCKREMPPRCFILPSSCSGQVRLCHQPGRDLGSWRRRWTATVSPPCSPSPLCLTPLTSPRCLSGSLFTRDFRCGGNSGGYLLRISACESDLLSENMISCCSHFTWLLINLYFLKKKLPLEQLVYLAKEACVLKLILIQLHI